MSNVNNNIDENSLSNTSKLGLSFDQVQKRKKDGLTNKAKSPKNNKIWFLLVSNFLALDFLTVLALMIVLLICEEPLWIVALIVAIFRFLLVFVKDCYSFITSIDRRSQTYQVLRDSNLVTLKRKQVVLDDVIALQKDDVLDFNVEIIEGKALVDTSMIDGVSVPTRKGINDVIFAGSRIIAGQAYGRVNALNLDCTSQRIQKESPCLFLRNSKSYKLARIFSWIICALSIITFLTALIVYTDQKAIVDFSSFKENMLPVARFLIFIVPLGACIITPLIYLISYFVLLNKKADVSKTNAIETLARADVICFDKTLTLTTGEYAVRKIVSLSNASQTDITQIVSDILNATNDDRPLFNVLRKTFSFGLSKDVVSSSPYDELNGTLSITFKGGKSYIFGDYENMNLINRAGVVRRAEEYTQQGFRVLFLAEKSSLSVKADEPYSTIAFIVFGEQINESAFKLVEYLKSQNKEIKILSSDDETRVLSVAMKLGIDGANNVASIGEYNLGVVKQVYDKYSVFSNANFEQKAQIVCCLQEEGKTVAMIGDGDNDALALKYADLGICVASGSALAKASSHIVMKDNNLSNLLAVIEEGAVIENKMSTLLTLAVSKSLALFALLFGYLLCSGISNISQIRFPFTLNNFMFIELFTFIPSVLILLFEKNKRVLPRKFVNYSLFSIILTSVIFTIIAGLGPMLFALQTNGVSYTGIPFDSYLNTYQSSTLVAYVSFLTPIFYIAIMFVSYWPRNKFRIFASCSLGVVDLIALLTCFVLGLDKNGNLFGIDFSFLSGVNYFSIIVAVILFAALAVVTKFIYEVIVSKGEKIDVEDQSEN